MISIHTTTQVVTWDDLEEIKEKLDFNPHHHAGGDHIISRPGGYEGNFNPHHHAGGDPAVQKYLSKLLISIHTTTQVVTFGQNDINAITGISIHTTTQVVTHLQSWD